jgi:Carboxypeptidase regulatory-like domain
VSAASRRGALLGLALLAVAVGIAWLLRGERGAEAPARRDGGAAAVAPSELPTFAAPVADADAEVAPLTAKEPDDAAAADERATGGLIVRVIWASDRTAAPSVGLTLISWEAPDPLFSERDGVTDADGLWAVPDAALGRATVYVDRANGGNANIRGGETTELLVEIPAGIFVHGLVVDADESPVAGADVWIRSGGSGKGYVVTHSAADGRFSLRDMGEHRDVGARAAGHVPSPLFSILDDGTHVCDVTLRLGRAGAQLAGRVLDSQGAPVPGAFVLVGPERGWPPPLGTQSLRVSGQPPRRVIADAQGAFAVTDLLPGTTPVAARARGHSPSATFVELDVGENEPFELVLPEGAIARGIVLDANGQPAPGATVSAGPYGNVDWVATKSGPDGRYELRDMPLGERELNAELKGAGQDATQLAITAGALLEWNPRLSLGLQIVGRVVDAAGAPVVGHHVGASAQLLGKTVRAQCDTDAQGRFTLNNCAVAGHRVTVRSPDWQTEVASQSDVHPGPDELLLQVVADARPSAFLVGRVLDARGHVPEMVMVGAADPASGNGEIEPVAAGTGEFRIGPLKPGAWDLHVLVTNRPDVRGRFELAADETRDVGTLVVSDPGRILVQLVLPPGALPSHVLGAAIATDGSRHSSLQQVEGEPSTWTSEPLPEGDYDVSIGTGSGGADTVFIASQCVRAHVTGGEDTRLDLVAERGVAQGIMLHTERTEPAPVTVLVLGSDGSEIESKDIHWYDRDDDGRDDDGYASFVGRPGTYTLRITSDGRVIEERSFSLPGNVNIAPSIAVNVP